MTGSGLPPLRRDPRYHQLDAWRGVACLMVVLHHAGFALLWGEADGSHAAGWLRWLIVAALRQMNLGVPLFFVISGYCIAASADATRRKGASPWTFLARRVRRIYPPYWAALALFVGGVAALDALGLTRLHGAGHALEIVRPGKLDRAQWIGNLTLTETWRPHVFGHEPEIYTRIAWSLCYEEQFYFVCFALLLLFRGRLYGALAIATGLIVAFNIAATDTGWIVRFSGTFPVLWHQFAAGLAVYYHLNVARTRDTRRMIELGLAALLAAGLATGDRATATAAAFALALIPLRRRDGAEARGLARALRACGRRCYSIYLIHLLVCTFVNESLYSLGVTGFWARVAVTIPLSSTAAVAAGWAFFAAVEAHFLNPPIVRRDPAAPPAPGRRPLAGEVA